MTKLPKLTSFAGAFLLGAGIAHSGTISASVFSGASATDFTTAGTLDYGYIDTNNGPFNSGAGTYNYTTIVDAVVSGSHTAGDVTVNNIGVGQKTNTDIIYSVDGTTDAIGAYGNMAGNENPAWAVTFNDLGVGQFDIVLFLGHNSTDRAFEMAVELFDSGGNDSLTGVNATDTGGSIAGLGGQSGGQYFKYAVSVETTDALADLTLTFGSTTGSAGEGYWAGYTITAVPEPSSFGLLAGILGFTWVMLRRR